MAFDISGQRELSRRFDEFPQTLHQALANRIHGLIDELAERVRSAAPEDTGKLRGQITERTFTDTPTRVAGYVEVYAPGVKDAYPKAATLEYGTNLPRRLRDSGGVFRRLGAGQKRIESRLSSTVHIEAFRYLRGPLVDMQAEVTAGLEAAVNDAQGAS